MVLTRVVRDDPVVGCRARQRPPAPTCKPKPLLTSRGVSTALASGRTWALGVRYVAHPGCVQVASFLCEGLSRLEDSSQPLPSKESRTHYTTLLYFTWYILAIHENICLALDPFASRRTRIYVRM